MPKKGFFDFELILAPGALSETKMITKKNGKSILVLYSSTLKNLDLNSFLGKILKAVNIDMEEDILLLSMQEKDRLSFSKLCQSYKIKNIISFGITPKQMGLNFTLQPYQVIDFNNRRFLFVHHLEKIFEERQKGEKKYSGMLWKELKGMF